MLREWGTVELGLGTIEIMADDENRPSRRVAEKAGFADTGEHARNPRFPGEGEYRVYRWSAA